MQTQELLSLTQTLHPQVKPQIIHYKQEVPMIFYIYSTTWVYTTNLEKYKVISLGALQTQIHHNEIFQTTSWKKPQTPLRHLLQ